MENSEAAKAAALESAIAKHVQWETLELEMTKLRETNKEWFRAREVEAEARNKNVLKEIQELRNELEKVKEHAENREEAKGERDTIYQEMEKIKTDVTDQKDKSQGFDPYPIAYDSSLEHHFEKTLEEGEKRFGKEDLEVIKEWLKIELL